MARAVDRSMSAEPRAVVRRRSCVDLSPRLRRLRAVPRASRRAAARLACLLRPHGRERGADARESRAARHRRDAARAAADQPHRRDLRRPALGRGRGADRLARGADQHARARLRARAGDGVVRDAALPRRDRLGDPRGAEQRPPQPMVPLALRPAALRASARHLFGHRADLRRHLLRLPLRVRARRERARPHPRRHGGRLRDPRRASLGARRGGSRCRWRCRRCLPA